MKKIGLVFNGGWAIYALANAPKYKDIYDLIYVHDLSWEKIKDLKALVIPFLSNHTAIAKRKEVIYQFLAAGNKVFVEGDSSPLWMEGVWEDRPVDNYWWVKNPENPPISETNYQHPIYQDLKPRHACWHVHGVYTSVPSHAEIIQKNEAGEIITWQTSKYGGVLFATTLDPFIEHGIRQITHLDNYVDKATEWLCGEKPEGDFSYNEADYGLNYVPV
ncbi:hypothetical protein N9R54_05650 [Pelobium sp.]|nr:hypothetical protein [Pelobium sp.]MDA9555703.1 hypothetical protein [Pelobium sp.]